MTRVESLINKLNYILATNELPNLHFIKHGICTKVTGKFNQSTVGSSYVWDVLGNDWVFFSANKPIIYHVLNYEKIDKTNFDDDISTNYNFSTVLIFDRNGLSDSQVVEWYKKRFNEFVELAENIAPQIVGNFDACLFSINYQSEQNYFTEYPITSEKYTPAVGCIKIDWELNLQYNNCITAFCQTENYCLI